MAKRSKHLRLAVVGRIDPEVVSRLEDLSSRVTTRTHEDLYGAFDRLVARRTDILCLDARQLRYADAGAVRLLREALGARVVLVAPPALEVEADAIAREAGGRVLVTPFTEIELAWAIDGADAEERRPPTAAFFDIARGIADEINNPLMFTSGHLELLRASLEDDHARRADCDAIRTGLERIAATIAKLETLGRLRAGELPAESIALRDLLDRVMATVTLPDSARLRVDDDVADAILRGDAELLARALSGLVSVAADLARNEGHFARIRIQARDDRDLCVRVRLRGPVLDAWRSPRTFEPYYLNRVLRGSPHGLTLFLVQAVAQAHGGRALARRRNSGDLQLEVRFPRADE